MNGSNVVFEMDSLITEPIS